VSEQQTQVGERLRSLIEDAEAAAAAIRKEADEESQRRLEEASEEARKLREEAEREAGDVRSSAAHEAKAARDAAQEDARRLRDEAESEARRELEDSRRRAEEAAAERIRRVEQLADSVQSRAEGVLSQLQRAEEVRQTLDALVGEMREAARRLAEDDPAGGGADKSSASLRLLEREQGEPEVRRLQEAEPEEDEAMAAARLVALQLAVEGRPRSEVEGHLRQHFEVEDPGPVLDEVFNSAASLGKGNDAG
jgi:hypothetical protein